MERPSQSRQPTLEMCCVQGSSCDSFSHVGRCEAIRRPLHPSQKGQMGIRMALAEVEVQNLTPRVSRTTGVASVALRVNRR